MAASTGAATLEHLVGPALAQLEQVAEHDQAVRARQRGGQPAR